MTHHRIAFSLNRPGALIAALPAVLGFTPADSLVLASIENGQLGAVMRVDLSHALEGDLEQIAHILAAASPEGIIAVVVLYACYSAQHSCHCHTRGWFAVFYAVIAAVMTVTLA